MSLTACVFRCGAYGDCLQAANILPELKRRGYHVTFVTSPRGYEVIRNDPHIDNLVVEKPGRRKGAKLFEHFYRLSKKFDLFINLTGTTDGALAALPGSINHGWPAGVRRAVMGKNYLEWIAQVAELPYKSEARFYPTPEEALFAKNYLDGDSFNIVWCLAGSTLDKWNPHQDEALRLVLTHLPNANIVLCGDKSCAPLEHGWRNTPKIHCESGRLSIRQTLALAKIADCVVGPDTGVLNAVAFESNAKVVMLSHLTQENLSKHWVNTTTLSAVGVDCYPCHRLHKNGDFCNQHSITGAALCQQSITATRIFEAVKHHYPV